MNLEVERYEGELRKLRETYKMSDFALDKLQEKIDELERHLLIAKKSIIAAHQRMKNLRLSGDAGYYDECEIEVLLKTTTEYLYKETV